MSPSISDDGLCCLYAPTNNIIKSVLGHSQLATTDRYCHPCGEAVVIDINDYEKGRELGG